MGSPRNLLNYKHKAISRVVIKIEVGGDILKVDGTFYFNYFFLKAFL